jgi:uncharacterized protein YbbC (DUF1343 family)
MRHGLTIGELLRLANDVYALGADLTVVPAAGWHREMLYSATGLPWVRPSPSMPDLESALHYPGTCLFEGTNLSVGRGTPRAFQVIGAPWLDPARVLRRLRDAPGGRTALDGVDAEAVEFTPESPPDGKYAGVPIRGVRLRVREPARYDPTRLGVALLVAVRTEHGDSLRFHASMFDRLAAGADLRLAVLAGLTAETIWGEWDGALTEFRRTRAKYLLY